MFDRILQIIVFVAKELHQNKSLNDIQVNNLHRLGYNDVEISTAISWLVDKSGSDSPDLATSKSFRVINDVEREMFTDEAINDLMQFQALGLISNEQIDFILDRVMMSGFMRIDRKVLGYILMAFVFQIAPENPYGSRIMLSGNDTIN